MVLVDTSVWVRALAGKQPYRSRLDDLLAQNTVLGHEFVYGELLIGDIGARTKVLINYALFRQAPTAGHADVVQLIRGRGLHGRGIGWIDAHLLASSMMSRAELYTTDGALQELAQELGVAYER